MVSYRIIHAAFLAALSTTVAVGFARAAVPDMLCHLQRQTIVDPITLETAPSATREVYRFKDSELFISSAERPEYHYNKVLEVEPGKYVSGHKTLMLNSEPYRSGTSRLLMFHSDAGDVRLAIYACLPSG